MRTRLLTLALLLALGTLTLASARPAPDTDRLRGDRARTAYQNWAANQETAIPAPTPRPRTIVPVEEAELLVIFDAPLVDILVPELITVLGDMDYSIAWWDVLVDGPVTWDLLDHDLDAVLLFSDNTGILPTRAYDDSNPLVQYMAAGGNLFYSDQDYFWANSEVTEPVFNPGDLAYDAFGIASGMNDPFENEDFYNGVADDPISGDWVDETFATNDMLTFDWDDNVQPVAGADVVFLGAVYEAPAGLVYENDWGGTTVHLSFNSLAAADGDWGGFTFTDQFTTLLDNVCEYFTGGMIEPVSLDLIATDPIIPPDGGTLVYDVHFETTVNLTVPGVTYWTMVTMPNGQTFGPLTQQQFTVTPFMDVTLVGVSQMIPAIAPGGTYTFTAHVGFFPNPYVTDDFGFEKLGALGQGDPDRWMNWVMQNQR